MSISYEGVAEQVVTMKLDTTGTAAKEGDLVSLAAQQHSEGLPGKRHRWAWCWV